MKINDTIVQEIVKGNLTTLYKNFRILKLDHEELEPTYKEVRFGIHYDFDIHDYIEEKYTIKNKKKIVIINRQQIRLKDFRTEIEEREDLMRKNIYEYLTEEDPTTSRVNKKDKGEKT